jgi:hypothetical protein
MRERRTSGRLLRLEQLEGRELLSVMSQGLALAASNAPIWGGGAAWSCNYPLFNWTGPNLLVNNAGLTSPHADLSVKAWASSGTVSANVGGNLSVTLPDTVNAGQKNVPVAIKFSPTSESMSGLLGAGLQIPLNLSLGYKNLPLGIGTGTIATSLDLVSVWDQYVKTPNIPQNFNLNTPATSYSPAFGNTISDKGSATLVSGLQIDALKLAGYLVPAAKVVDTVAAINLGTNLSVTRTDKLAFSELDGTVTINGTQVPFAIGTSGSTTAYVNIPSTTGSTVSVVVGNFKLKNDFYTQFGLTASPYVEVDAKVPLTFKVYRNDFTPINVTVFSTPHSSLGISSASTITGTIRTIQLPDLNTDAGVVARLLIAESLTPAYSSYNAAEVLRGMQAMKAVVNNRLRNNPAQFLAPGARTLTDIIVAPNQFEGFSRNSAGQVVLSSKVQGQIQGALDLAKSNPSGLYGTFVSNAIKVANDPVDDPFIALTTIGGVPVLPGAFGWKTVGSGSPGPRFIAIPGGIIGGNQFYALRR